MLLNPLTGKRQVVWALVVVLVYSRHTFVWLTTRQTLEATIEGVEASWRFFAGVPQRLVLDNFPAAIAGPDALEPACARSLSYELVDVRRLERIIVLALEGDASVDEPLSAAQTLPSRFARPGSTFDHRYSVPTATPAEVTA